MKRLLLLLIVMAAVCAARAAQAGPNYGADQKQLRDLRAKFRQLEKTNPDQAVVAHRTFVQSRPDMDPVVAGQVVYLLAGLYQEGLKQADAALELCDWALQRQGEEPSRMRVLAARAKVLIAENRAAEAVAVLEREWWRLPDVWRDDVGAVVYQYTRALVAAGQKEKAIEVLRKAMSQNLSFTGYWYQSDEWGEAPMGWGYEALINDALQRKADDEALGWAKVNFLLVPAADSSVRYATGLLARAWTARDGSDKAVAAFVASLGDPAQPSPLVRVKLPELDLAMVTALTERRVRHWMDEMGHYHGLLLSGRLFEALAAARIQYADDPAHGVQYVEMTLKAGDQNLKRVTDFRRFRETGESLHPLDEFVKEHAKGNKTLADMPKPVDLAALRPAAAAVPAAAEAPAAPPATAEAPATPATPAPTAAAGAAPASATQAPAAQAPGKLKVTGVFSNFEDGCLGWTGVTRETGDAAEGEACGKIDVSKPFARFTMRGLDWSTAAAICLWVRADRATGEKVRILLPSNDPATPQNDLYAMAFTVDWTGWKRLRFEPKAFTPVGKPVGWHHIDNVTIAGEGWGKPDAANLWIDQLAVERGQ